MTEEINDQSKPIETKRALLGLSAGGMSMFGARFAVGEEACAVEPHSVKMNSEFSAVSDGLETSRPPEKEERDWFREQWEKRVKDYKQQLEDLKNSDKKLDVLEAYLLETRDFLKDARRFFPSDEEKYQIYRRAVEESIKKYNDPNIKHFRIKDRADPGGVRG